MGEFNSDDHYIYYCGQGSLRRNGVALILNKGVQNAVLGCNLKNDKMISVSKANHSTSQLSKPLPQPVMLKELEIEWVHEDLQDLLELTYKKDVLFIIGDLNAEVGSQGTPGVIGKFGIGIQNELGQRLTVLPRGCSDHSKHPLPTTQEKTLHMDITRWSIMKSD